MSAPRRSTRRSSRTKPDVKRLVGTEGNFGEQLGLTKDWVVRVVRLVGNYADVYDRNVGVKSKLNIPRGINASGPTAASSTRRRCADGSS